MLAFFDTLEEWRHYLTTFLINIFTDNSALWYLQNSARLSSRQIRWLEKLQVYTPLKMAHNPGMTNTAADALSRSPALQEEVIENGRPLQLELSFLGVLAVATPSTFYFNLSGLARRSPGLIGGKITSMNLRSEMTISSMTRRY